MRVAILIPTVDRYPYLRKLLDGIAKQNHLPAEVIIVDQTAESQRDLELANDYSHLPLKVIYQNFQGQSSSRNLGLRNMTSEYILFLDDDVEIPSDFIERHLHNISSLAVDVSSGSVYEPPQNFADVATNLVRASDVFPTGNSIVGRGALLKSGLFDLAYDKKAQADADIGMRLYLAGCAMICDERSPILHHRAPRGGLRAHKARVVTRSSGRSSLLKRNLMSDSNLYFGLRYFTKEQVFEMCLISLIGTFRGSGSFLWVSLRAILSVVLLPYWSYVLYTRYRQATEMLAQFPQIEWLSVNDN